MAAADGCMRCSAAAYTLSPLTYIPGWPRHHISASIAAAEHVAATASASCYAEELRARAIGCVRA